ncbi:MAG: thioesterase domain-containing protein [Planctomycetota bacterium]
MNQMVRPTTHQSHISRHFEVLRGGSDRSSTPPLFCFHPSGGDIGVYRKFVRQLNSVCAVIGVKPSQEAVAGPSSIESMAECYAGLIDRFQSSGPIRLLGFSLGGFTAAAVARILDDNDREVSFLGMIDSDLRWSGDTDSGRVELALRISQISRKLQDSGLLKRVDDNQGLADAQAIADLCFKADDLTGAEIVAECDARGHETRDVEGAKLFLQFVNNFADHCRLIKRHKARAIPCPVQLWWPTDPEVTDGARLKAWNPFVQQEISERWLPGSHYEIMRMPAVRQLAADVDASLALKPTTNY